MTTTDTTASPADLAPPIFAAGEYDKYTLRTPGEVLMVLRGLYDRKAQITVFFNDGQDMLLTMLVEVAPDRLIFDVGADEELNRRAAVAGRHYCVALLDKVRIQFLLGAFTPTSHGNRPAFFCAPPLELLRLQRREFYRLVAPAARPLVCSMPLPLPDGGMYLHEARVYDISCGGLGLVPPPEHVPFEVGMAFANCRIDLPEVGIVAGTLSVRQVGIALGTRRQAEKRTGCEFVDLPGALATLLQRYIIKVERERKARASGLGF